MTSKLLLATLVSALVLIGCGDSGIGSAPVVSVTPEQRAKDLNSKAQKTVSWLEGLPADQRKTALDRTPQIKEALKGATDPALKTRISALGVGL
ncbi:MAG TPA: hypothetical protein VG944_06765 [Fimbriimonas sp.]|nr:hypothetical protein [Fimbriimonas sp.]